ncbi:MAG: PQQ-binding-like beta-propeller repeat protein [Pirellulales bacterium]
MRSIAIATLVVCTIAMLPARGLLAATSRGGIISQSTALKHGLVRDWYAHVEIDGARDRVLHAVVDRDSVFFQSELGLVENVDAATGRQLWIREIGRQIDPVLPLHATDAWVAVIGGPRLYLLDRASGHVEFVRRFDGVASAGPSVSALRVYVPLMQGPLESFQLPMADDAAKTGVGQLPPRTFPWKHFSSGSVVGGLLLTPQAIAWATDRGYFYISELNSRQPLYRVEIGDDIVVPLAYHQPLIYGASLGGFVYAVDETTGSVTWRVSLGSPIRVAPAMVRDRLYVCPDRRGMYCFDASQGGELWWAPRAIRFVAASPTRIYASDAAHRLLILDAQTGARLGMLPTQNLSLAVSNVATDRIFLGTPSGSIQCLHEIELTEPVRHWQKATEKQPDAPDKEPESGETTPAAGDQPTAGEAEPDQRDPFGGDDQDPFGGEDRDPFGDE